MRASRKYFVDVSEFFLRVSVEYRVGRPRSFSEIQIRVALTLFTVLLIGLQICRAQTALTVTGISPQSGSTNGGTTVTITGTNFSVGATVKFDSSAATNVTVVDATTITAMTPPHSAGGTNVIVRNPDGQSATLSGVVQLLNNPGYEAGAASWKFNGSGTAQVLNSAGNAHSGNNYADLVSAAGNHPVYYAADQNGNAQYFRISAGDNVTFGGWAYRVSGDGKARWGIEVSDANKLNPVYISASPYNAAQGIWTQFQSTYSAAGNGFMRFYAEINSSTTVTDIRFDDAVLQQSTPGGGFTYVGVSAPPAITSLTPLQGYSSGGDTVTVSGSGFVQGAKVAFGGVLSTSVTVVSANQVRALSPAHSPGLVDVTVTNPDGQSASYISLLHNEGFESGGSYWKLAGSGTATFGNGAQNAHNGIGYAELTASGSGSHPVLYASDSSGNSLYIPVSTGDTVTFGGYAFGVSGNGSARWGLEVTDADKKNALYVSAPPYVAPDPIWIRQQGTYTVPADKKFVRLYADLNGATASSKARFEDAVLKISSANLAGFQYLSAPIVTAVSPSWGAPAGGTTRTIYGTGFAPGAAVKFGGVDATNVQVVSANAIVAFAPPHATGEVSVSVLQGAQNASLSNAYTYRNPPPAPAALTNIRHIIFTFQENRSFDNYFSQMNTYRQMRGVNDNEADVASPNTALLDASGIPVTPYHFRTVCHENTQPSWNASHVDYNGGKMDGFLKTTNWFEKSSTYDPTGTRPMGYYDWTDLPYYYELGFQFAISDRWFSSVLGPTNANRPYTFAATSLGWKSDPQPPSGGFPNLTIFDLLDQAGVSWRYYYQQANPVHIPIWSVYYRDSANVVPITNYFEDIKNESTFPSVIFIEEARDEHPNPNPGVAVPPQSIQLGASVIKSFVDALMASSSWNSSVFILSYDEGGGLYDHVAPPNMPAPDGIPPKTQPEADQNGLFNIAGFRVPVTVVSPWVKPHFVSHINRDHTAILKFIETRFGLPPLTARDDASDDMTEFFDFSSPSLQTPPPMPTQPTNGTCDLSLEKAPGR